MTSPLQGAAAASRRRRHRPATTAAEGRTRPARDVRIVADHRWPQARRGDRQDRFQFNPKELTIAKTAKWESKAANRREEGAAAGVQGTRTGQADAGDVLRRHRQARRQRGRGGGQAVLLLRRRPTRRHANDKPMPPLVVFHWGGITSFPAYVTSVSAKYTLFTPDGTPIRAICTVSLQEMPGENGQAEPDLRIASPRAASTGWSSATPWPRSPTASTATRRCGGRWPTSTGSTTRSGSRWAAC